ncbi:MAG TPA: hypothetical protein VGS80_03095, partial [Ktedonobacterales bacterium]|nr:hypothetical protein [Ktedonobacterales bacterium]
MRANGGLRRPRRFLRSWRPLVVVISVITLLALCAGASYALGIVEEIGYSGYRNTSPPLAVSAGGVTLASAHARYLILDTITVTLTNHSGAPIYVPEMAAGTVSGVPIGRMFCWHSDVEYQSANGWEALGGECWSPPACPSGTSPGTPEPAVGVVASGQTVVLDSYDGQESYPPLAPGAYRFSVAYSPTPFQAPLSTALPNGVTLTTPSVTL